MTLLTIALTWLAVSFVFALLIGRFIHYGMEGKTTVPKEREDLHPIAELHPTI